MPTDWVNPLIHDRIKQDGPPSPWYIPFVAIVTDQPATNKQTPFHFVSQSLCKANPFFALVFRLEPSLFFYASDFHRQNILAAEINRFSYLIEFCRESNFTDDRFMAIAQYPVAVVYVESGISQETFARLSQLTNAILVCADSSLPGEANSQKVISASEASAVKLVSLLAGVLESAPADDAAQLEPANIIRNNQTSFRFGNSPLSQAPIHLFLANQVNEILENHLRRTLLPEILQEQPPVEQRPAFIVDSIRNIFADKLTDQFIVSVQEKDAEGVPSAIHDLVKAYLLEETEENYRAIHDRTREIASRYPGIYSMILCCPCVNREIPVEILGRAVPSRVLKYAFRGQAGKSQYLSAVDARDLRSDKDREQHHALLTILQLETVYFSQILTLYALSARQPVLRLPQFSSGLIGNLKQMRQTYLARNSRAFMRELEKFGDALRAQFAPEHLDLLGETRSSSLKIFSDMPIEWMAVNEVPLVYQRPISRLPLTPGNSLLAHYQASESTIHLTSDDIKNILVLNCLDKSDRLFRYPITLAKSLKELGIPHIYRDVSSLQEYLSALSDTKPTILIHFGHGAYSRSDNTGYLYIGSEKTKVWDFSPTVIPAILMLGACDTAILAETHNTPSNAWLALGARTVIGTYFPVEIDLTLVLYTRIIANLFEAIHGDMYVKTWEKLVSKTMILNRYLDYKYQFAEWRRRRRMPRVPPEFAYEYTYLWNQRVGDLTEGYKSCTSLMKTAFERFGDEYSQSFDRFLHETKVIPHTQFFSQLGSPETIFLVKGKKQVFEERLMRYWEERAREDNGLISS